METLISGQLFEWDRTKAKLNKIKHGISFKVATAVFDDPNRIENCDEDCPPMTEQQLEELDYLMCKYNTRRITKEIKMKEFPERFQKRTVS